MSKWPTPSEIARLEKRGHISPGDAEQLRAIYQQNKRAKGRARQVEADAAAATAGPTRADQARHVAGVVNDARAKIMPKKQAKRMIVLSLIVVAGVTLVGGVRTGRLKPATTLAGTFVAALLLTILAEAAPKLAGMLAATAAVAAVVQFGRPALEGATAFVGNSASISTGSPAQQGRRSGGANRGTSPATRYAPPARAI